MQKQCNNAKKINERTIYLQFNDQLTCMCSQETFTIWISIYRLISIDFGIKSSLRDEERVSKWLRATWLDNWLQPRQNWWLITKKMASSAPQMWLTSLVEAIIAICRFLSKQNCQCFDPNHNQNKRNILAILFEYNRLWWANKKKWEEDWGESLGEDARVCYLSGPQDRHSKRAKMNDNILARWGRSWVAEMVVLFKTQGGKGCRDTILIWNILFFI